MISIASRSFGAVLWIDPIQLWSVVTSGQSKIQPPAGKMIHTKPAAHARGELLQQTGADPANGWYRPRAG